MRGIGVRASLFAALSAATIVSTAVPASAEGTAAASPEAGGMADYYTRRAKRILDAEKASAARPHPLAAAHPGMDVVVCEAGCADRRGAHVVFLREQVVATEQREAMMEPTSDTTSRGADASSPAGIVCVAGCYGETYGEKREPAVRAISAPVERMTLPPRDKLSPVR